MYVVREKNGLGASCLEERETRYGLISLGGRCLFGRNTSLLLVKRSIPHNDTIAMPKFNP